MKTALLAAVFFVSMMFLLAAIAAQAARVLLGARYGVWVEVPPTTIPRLAFWPHAAPSLPPASAAGQATVFHARGDRNNPNLALGCVRAARRLGLRDLADHLPIVAMREGPGSAPCGMPVWVESGGGVGELPLKGTWALRLTSGPYGQDCAGVRRVGAVLGPGCRWLGVIDLSPAVATAIDLPGRGLQRRGDVRVRWHRR